MPRTRILIVEDEPAMAEVLQMRLEQWGFDAAVATDGVQAERQAEAGDPDIVITDVVMPGRSGLELLRALKAGDPARPVILMTAQGNIDMAVEAIKQGALDFLTKPLDYSKLKAVLESAEEEIELRRESRRLAEQPGRDSGFGAFIGRSRQMRDVYALIQSLAASDAPAILTGESGTGKELAARTIHDRSRRAAGPFIAINAAAIPETLMESEFFGHERGAFTGAVGMRAGCFELANGGTLLLDEVAEMPLHLQPKLLRVLEDGRVRRLGGRQELALDVRVIAATNRDPRDAMQEGRLREDLYYRLNVFTVALPPLREREDDIQPLVQHFIREFNAKHGATVETLRSETLDCLLRYRWPGNVRELRNVIERAVILAKGEWIELSHLPAYVRHPAGSQDTEIRIAMAASATAADVERALILKTLEQTGNNKAKAARQLGLDVKTIRNKLKAYGVEP